MLGKNLLVYQMNSDMGISILTSQNQINDKLSDNEKNKLFENLEQLKNFINIDLSFENINPNDIKSIIDNINKYINNNKNKVDEIKKIKNLKKELLYITSPANRFIEKESAFIEAMKKGDWVLIDGIEFAPHHFSEKISSLCDEKKELELFEYGEKYSFKEGENIHEDFHLFITYNPLSQTENTFIDQSLLNKCISFTLPSIDSSIESSAQILYGILRNNDYQKKISKNIAGRLAKVHEIAKNKSVINPDLFAGDIPFTGRNIIYLSKFFEKKDQDLKEKIEKSIVNIYLNSYNSENNRDEFKKELLNAFIEKEINFEIVENDNKEKYEKLLRILTEIQKCTVENIDGPLFNISSFINQECCLIQIQDIKMIERYIFETIEYLDKRSIQINNELLDNYYQLEIILKVFNDIKESNYSISSSYTMLQLNDPDLLKIEKLNQPLLRFKLLTSLIQHSNLFSKKLNHIFYNKKVLDLCTIIETIEQNKMLSDFEHLISFLKENHFLFEVIEKIIPFSKFETTNFNLLPYWIHLFVSLYNNKVNFKIEISGTEYLFDFKDSNQEKIKIHLIFQDNLYISKSSFIYQKSLSNKEFYEGVKECNDDSSKLMYFLIMKMMNDINITRKYCNSLKSLYQRDNLENIYIDNFLSLNNLFNYEKDERIPLIAKCWTIVYSLSSGIINYLLKYSLDLEIELLNSIKKIYNTLDNIKFDESKI
jgi:hypothetical protein